MRFPPPVLTLLLVSLTCGPVLAVPDEATATPAPATAEPAAPVPAHPSELFARLSDATRPQWRQHYRPTVTRCIANRHQAALGLGAVCADLYLAAQARDAQQIRNLLQDEETIEKTLGLVEPMARFRQALLTAAQEEQADWPAIIKEVGTLNDAHHRQLISQKDEALAELAGIGQWIRCLQICHAVAIDRELFAESSLAIGDPRLVRDMIRHLESISDSATETDRSLKLLHRRLAALEKLWRPDVVVINPADRLNKSAALLNDVVEQLIQDQPAPESTPESSR